MKGIASTSVIFGLLMGSTLAMAQAKASRNPSAACRVVITSPTLRSESGVEQVDIANQRIVNVFPDVTEFSSFIPKRVALKFQYNVQNCQPPLTVRVGLVPMIGTNKIDFNREDTVNAQIDLARKNSVAGPVAYMPDVQLAKLGESGEIVIPAVEVRKFYNNVPKNQWIWSMNFAISVLEGNREVGANSDLVVESDLRD